MTATPRSDALLAEIRREFPRFRVVHKRGHALSHAIDLALRAVTLGAQRAYLTRYHTVLFDTLYVPDLWDGTDDVSRLITLRHERVHLRQRRRMGTVAMTLWYLFPLAPLGLAWGRARIEWEAYEETLRAIADERGLAAARSPDVRAYLIAQFTSGAYGWMWPFPRAVGRWIDEALARIEASQREG